MVRIHLDNPVPEQERPVQREDCQVATHHLLPWIYRFVVCVCVCVRACVCVSVEESNAVQLKGGRKEQVGGEDEWEREEDRDREGEGEMLQSMGSLVAVPLCRSQYIWRRQKLHPRAIHGPEPCRRKERDLHSLHVCHWHWQRSVRLRRSDRRHHQKTFAGCWSLLMMADDSTLLVHIPQF